jgi:hypothetical protein
MTVHPTRPRHEAITELIRRHRPEYDQLHDAAREHYGLVPLRDTSVDKGPDWAKPVDAS